MARLRSSEFKLAVIFGGLCTVLSFQACAPGNKASVDAASESHNYATGSPFEKASLALMKTSCGSCHREGSVNSGALTSVSDVNYLVNKGYVTPGRPNSSLLYMSLTGAAGLTPMPPGTALTASERDTIGRWITEIKPFITVTTAPAPTSSTTTTQYTGPVVSYQTQIRPFAMTSCAGCHPKVSSYATLMFDGVWVSTLGYPEASLLYISSLPDRGMPPANSSAPKFTPEQSELLRLWILQGAPNN